MIDLMLSWQFT